MSATRAPLSATHGEESPRVLRLFLWIIAAVLIASVAALVLSWILFPAYAREFIVAHPGSFEGIDEEKPKQVAVAVGLGMRTLVAFTWAATFNYLRRAVNRAEKWLPHILLWYPLLASGAFAYLLTQPALVWQQALRWFQLVACLLLTLVVVLPNSLAEVRRYVRQRESVDEHPGHSPGR